jgi:LCP family protein required for cell wall assembly
VLLIFSVLLLVFVIGMYWWANSIFGRIERVEVSQVLSGPESGTNYLIVGSDSRDELNPDSAGGAEGNGERSDTMMVMHFDGGETKITSVPRDLLVDLPFDSGACTSPGRINAAYNPNCNGGPAQLIQTVSESVGIPISRYMEVDFASFASLVDGLGGITICFENPAFDTNSGLNITEPGCQELDGTQALAYVRSRHLVEIINGEEVSDPTGDVGRVLRQQQFMRAVFSKLGDSKNPFSLMNTFSDVADGLRIDDDMSLWNAMMLGWWLRGGEPEAVPLPTANDTGPGGASVLVPAEGFEAAIAQFQ